MSVTRQDLDRALSHLLKRPYSSLQPDTRLADHWDIFPAVSNLRPRLAGKNYCQLWWSTVQDQAFTPALQRPILLHYHGDHTALHLAFAKARLTVRVIQGDPGQLIVGPDADQEDCDLKRLLRAFKHLRSQGIVALPLAGFTRSDGWSDVAGAQRSPQQTAVFWHAQGQEHLSETGMLGSGMYLYWRGDAQAIRAGLQTEKLSVVLPDNKDVAILVKQLAAEPVVPTLAHCLPDPELQAALPADSLPETLELIGCLIQKLWWTPEGFLLLACGHSQSISHEFPLQWINQQGERVATARGLSSGAICGSACFLPDGRLITGWYDYEGGSFLRILEHSAPGEGLEITRLELSHPAHLDPIAFFKEQLILAILPGLSLRRLGPPQTPEKRKAAGVVVRRQKPLPPGPWQEVSRLSANTLEGISYNMVATSNDWLICGGSGQESAFVWDSAKTLRHTLSFYEPDCRWRLVSLQLQGAMLGVVLRDWKNDRDFYYGQLWDLKSGKKLYSYPDITSMAWAGSTLLLGTQGGELLKASGGKTERLHSLVKHGHISAIAAGPQLAIGSSRGEVFLKPPL
jgi:hypothetical protein